MPLSDEERVRLQQLRQQLTGTASSTPAMPGALPPEISNLFSGQSTPQPYLSSFGPRGGQLTVPPPASVDERKLKMKAAELKLKAMYPTPTESERATNRIAANALRNLNEIRSLLQVQPEQKILRNRKPITVFKQNEPLNTNPFLAPDAKQLRTKFNSLVDLLALLRTGKAGETRQQKRIEAEYNPGEFDADETIINRLSGMEAELRGFASGELKSPLDDSPLDDPLGLR